MPSAKMKEPNPKEFYLIRVPRKVKVEELNGVTIDLEPNGGTESLSTADPSTSYGYEFMTSESTKFHHLTRLKASKSGIRIDPTYELRGCINFYENSPMPNGDLTPLVPECPNDSIDDIVNKSRSSVKRQLEQSTSTKRKKRKRDKQSC